MFRLKCRMRQVLRQRRLSDTVDAGESTHARALPTVPRQLHSAVTQVTSGTLTRRCPGCAQSQGRIPPPILNPKAGSRRWIKGRRKSEQSQDQKSQIRAQYVAGVDDVPTNFLRGPAQPAEKFPA